MASPRQPGGRRPGRPAQPNPIASVAKAQEVLALKRPDAEELGYMLEWAEEDCEDLSVGIASDRKVLPVIGRLVRATLALSEALEQFKATRAETGDPMLEEWDLGPLHVLAPELVECARYFDEEFGGEFHVPRGARDSQSEFALRVLFRAAWGDDGREPIAPPGPTELMLLAVAVGYERPGGDPKARVEVWRQALRKAKARLPAALARHEATLRALEARKPYVSPLRGPNEVARGEPSEAARSTARNGLD